MAGYRRRATRAPRAVEVTATQRERDALALAVDQLKVERQQLRQAKTMLELEVEKLLHDKIALGMELNVARRHLEFLRGIAPPQVIRRLYG